MIVHSADDDDGAGVMAVAITMVMAISMTILLVVSSCNTSAMTMMISMTEVSC